MDGKKTYECDKCSATAVAGSDDLLENWTKHGFSDKQTGCDVRWYLCGNCQGDRR